MDYLDERTEFKIKDGKLDLTTEFLNRGRRTREIRILQLHTYQTTKDVQVPDRQIPLHYNMELWEIGMDGKPIREVPSARKNLDDYLPNTPSDRSAYKQLTHALQRHFLAVDIYRESGNLTRLRDFISSIPF